MKELSPTPLAHLLDATEAAALLGASRANSASPASGWPLRELLSRAGVRAKTTTAPLPGEQLVKTTEPDHGHLRERQRLVHHDDDTAPPGSLAVIAVGPGTDFDPSAGGQRMLVVASSEAGSGIDFTRPLAENISRMAFTKGCRPSQVTVGVPDEDLNRCLVEEIVTAGASIRMIPGSSIAGMLACCRQDRGIDAWIGDAGSAEAVIAAGSLKLLGGMMQARAHPAEHYRAQGRSPFGAGIDDRYTIDDLDPGPLFRFVATGISDNPLLPGVRQETHTRSTWSLALDASAETVAWIRSDHPADRLACL